MQEEGQCIISSVISQYNKCDGETYGQFAKIEATDNINFKNEVHYTSISNSNTTKGFNALRNLKGATIYTYTNITNNRGNHHAACSYAPSNGKSFVNIKFCEISYNSAKENIIWQNPIEDTSIIIYTNIIGNQDVGSSWGIIVSCGAELILEKCTILSNKEKNGNIFDGGTNEEITIKCNNCQIGSDNRKMTRGNVYFTNEESIYTNSYYYQNNEELIEDYNERKNLAFSKDCNYIYPKYYCNTFFIIEIILYHNKYAIFSLFHVLLR